jgi:hypothetical protein
LNPGKHRASSVTGSGINLNVGIFFMALPWIWIDEESAQAILVHWVPAELIDIYCRCLRVRVDKLGPSSIPAPWHVAEPSAVYTFEMCRFPDALAQAVVLGRRDRVPRRRVSTPRPTASCS